MLTLVIALQAHAADAAAPAKPRAAPARKAGGDLSVQLRYLAGGCQAPGRSALRAAAQQRCLPALDKLSPEQYRSMHFNPDAGIWRAEKLPFRLELLRAAPNLPHGHDLHRGGRRRHKMWLHRRRCSRCQAPLPAQLGRVSLPLSGFRVRSRINSNKVWDEFLVFQGASYFRAVAKNLLYGLSARGLAINTGEPSGEEFPVFTHFWIERPGPNASAIVIYALLESKSADRRLSSSRCSRASETLTDVELTLFPRAEMRVARHRAADLDVSLR